MNLDDLHKRFSKDETYRRSHEELRGWVHIGLVCRASRETAKLSRTQLAKDLGISSHALACFESGDERRPSPILALLTRWERDLITEGFNPAPLMQLCQIMIASQKAEEPEPRERPSAFESQDRRSIFTSGRRFPQDSQLPARELTVGDVSFRYENKTWVIEHRQPVAVAKAQMHPR